MHPGRKFPLDGHLVGSIGEAAAEVLLELSLVTTSSTGYDALARDGRKVEIKATYGTKGEAIRGTSDGTADALIVLKLSRFADTEHEVVFNGPLEIAMQADGAIQSNGQAPIGLNRLRTLDRLVPPEARIARRQSIP